jgi:hypothetical protein
MNKIKEVDAFVIINENNEFLSKDGNFTPFLYKSEFYNDENEIKLNLKEKQRYKRVIIKLN